MTTLHWLSDLLYNIANQFSAIFDFMNTPITELNFLGENVTITPLYLVSGGLVAFLVAMLVLRIVRG